MIAVKHLWNFRQLVALQFAWTDCMKNLLKYRLMVADNAWCGRIVGSGCAHGLLVAHGGAGRIGCFFRTSLPSDPGVGMRIGAVAGGKLGAAVRRKVWKKFIFLPSTPELGSPTFLSQHHLPVVPGSRHPTSGFGPPAFGLLGASPCAVWFMCLLYRTVPACVAEKIAEKLLIQELVRGKTWTGRKWSSNRTQNLLYVHDVPRGTLGSERRSTKTTSSYHKRTNLLSNNPPPSGLNCIVLREWLGRLVALSQGWRIVMWRRALCLSGRHPLLF